MTGNARAPLGSVAVVGGGLVALVASLGFARAVPGARITWVPAPVPDDAFADRLPLALPSVQPMLQRLGLDPDVLVARGLARRRMASRFVDWSRDGGPWLVGDDVAVGAGSIAPHQLWLRARDGGGSVPPFHALFPDCVAAMAGRPDATADAALHLDPQGCGQAAAQLAAQAGMTRAAPLRAVERDARGVAALRLEDNSRLTADLFVDASGAARRLAPADAVFERWNDTLPCDRLVLVPDDAPPAFAGDDHRATDAGWQARWRGLRAAGFAATTGDGGGLEGDAIALVPGRRAELFGGNVLALGEAAAQPGPLGLCGLTLALAHLGLALELLPARADEPLLRREYNRRAGQAADRLRDFLGAHYRAGGRQAGRFWQPLAQRPCPPALANLLAQFAQRGHLVTADEDLIGRDAWLAVLIGQGPVPRRRDPIALSLSPDAAADAIGRLAARITARP